MTDDEFEFTAQAVETEVRDVYNRLIPLPEDMSGEAFAAALQTRVSVAAVMFLRHVAPFRNPDLSIEDAAVGIIMAIIDANTDFIAEIDPEAHGVKDG